MPTRRDILSWFGLGGLVVGPVATAAGYQAVTGESLCSSKTKPVVRVYVNVSDDRESRIWMLDGRELWGVTGFRLVLDKHAPPECYIDFHDPSATGCVIVSRDSKLAAWFMSRRDEQFIVVDEAGDEVEGVDVTGYECNVHRLSQWTVRCRCEVRWLGIRA